MMIPDVCLFGRDERASVLIVFSLMAFVILGLAGVAVDYTRATNVEARIRDSLDAAVLAAIKQDVSQRQGTAEKVFARNLGTPAGLVVKLEFASTGPTTYSGTARATMKTSIAAAIGIEAFPIAAFSEARITDSGKACILVLSTTAPQALLVNGGANVVAPDCEVHVHSTASPAAVFNAGTSLDTKRICIKGTTILDNGGHHPNTNTGCSPSADPYVGRFPEPASATCDFSNLNFNGGNVNLTPGVYCGWVNFNNAPNVTFAPGVYIIKNGGWNVNAGNWSGDRVTFYFADTSKIQFNSAVAARLTAPTSGPYENVIITEKPGLAASHFVLDDSRGFDVRGLIYLPSRDTIFNSASGLQAKDFTIVVNTLILNQTNWNLESTTTEIAGGGDGVPRLIN